MVSCDFAFGCCCPTAERSSLHRAVLEGLTPDGSHVNTAFVTGNPEAAFLLLWKEDAGARGFLVHSHV